MTSAAIEFTPATPQVETIETKGILGILKT